MDIYVGNLPFSASEEEITELFASHGTVEKVKMVTDRETGRPRGFAFVTMVNDDEAKAAISALNGSDFGGRPLRINPAEPREARSGGGGFKGGGGGGGYKGGGGGGYKGGGGGGGYKGGGGGYKGGGGDRRGGGGGYKGGGGGYKGGGDNNYGNDWG